MNLKETVPEIKNIALKIFQYIFQTALASSSGGIQTALNTISTLLRQVVMSVVNRNCPSLLLRSTISSSPGP